MIDEVASAIPRSETNERTPRIGLALSGGGFRAAAFHLGVLKRLEELEVLPQVSLISTVSGGSIMGGLYAVRCVEHGDGSPGSYPVDSLIAELQPLLTSNLRGRALLGNPLRTMRFLASYIIPWVRRMPLLVGKLDSELFRNRRLSDLPTWIVINATSLATGKAWKFFSDRAGDFLIGATDKMSDIKIAEAVGASAAYPGLFDPYPLKSRWEDLRGDLLDDRWERPPQDSSTDISRWRKQFGERKGAMIIPLVDGGIYDNEGLNSLRGAKITHAIVSSSTLSETNYNSRLGCGSLLRTIGVMHSRLGGVTRQHAHEMTHLVDPSIARDQLTQVAARLRQKVVEDVVDVELIEIAEQLDLLSGVGIPMRQHQYTATAQILLCHNFLASNRVRYDPRVVTEVPVEDRSLSSVIVDELSRVRTDLDALDLSVFELLVAHGYFLTDANIKAAMPDIVVENFDKSLDKFQDMRPTWCWAHSVVQSANANSQDTVRLLRAAAKRKIVGHTSNVID